jgi:uncharacterized protein (DUF362 family)
MEDSNTKSIIFAEKLQQDNILLEDQFQRAFQEISIIDDFQKAKAVFIKPNLTYPQYKEGVTTRVEFIESLVASLRKINNTTKIYIGDGEGGYNSFSMTEAMETMGFYDLEKKYQNVKIINLSKIQSCKVELKANNKPYPIDLPELIVKEVDFSITCPVPKVHCMTNVSLAFKNQWGCLPDTMRMKNHYVLHELIGQICEILKFKYVFLDGKYGLNINGPMVGDPIRVDWFISSNSLGAFDAVVSGIMGFNWKNIKHLKGANSLGLIPDEKDIKIIGNIESFKKDFSLKRNFWNYPALLAFHSKRLTHFFYFSRYTKILHDFMYLFRKRPIE